MNQNQTLEMPVPRGATDDKTGVAVGTGLVDVDAYIDFQCPFCKQFELDSGDATQSTCCWTGRQFGSYVTR